MAAEGHIYKTAAVSGLTLLLGLVVGTFGLAEIRAPKIVFKTVQGPTVRVEVPGPSVVPQSCRDALKEADALELAQLDDTAQIITTMGGAFDVIRDASNAYRAGDWTGVATVLNRSHSIPPAPSKLTSLDAYHNAAGLCRGS
jgi:hypothetical protein